MSAVIQIQRAGPLTSIQDAGRFGMLAHGISASGPMDRGGYAAAGALAGAGLGGVEFTMAGLEIFVASGRCRVGFAGGHFVAHHNGRAVDWFGAVALEAGDRLAVTPGAWGNYGYLRFDGDIVAQRMMGSIATSSRAGLGGLEGRALRAGDVIALEGSGGAVSQPAPLEPGAGPIRFVWGLHADLFPQAARQGFVEGAFAITTRMDRMGVRLDDIGEVFGGASSLSLVSDAIVPGDIQILGDGTPIVLMRDHQPTGGYPRIATVITADLDRFAQMRAGTAVAFEPVGVEHAQALLRSG
ncbi:MAG: biotin-dependent carboxyltransferase family protein [Candidatus Devosia phytovorans]|uniref:Biotin-dependent carboxyltransferase family protein n=1 Tax=Candidatus Devosia phytovorans TaxID=3121372 RepID=A0AAJ5VY65_9HYPH|nr:biotin-dependent carboxyltransferase family protein [Devosia sp.]WEK06060.1 MAG: biotin-dependent carboxyltransferase family protein [Devosia sp.]